MRHAFALELALDLEQRLRALERDGRACGCRHGELRAIIAKLRAIAAR